MYEHVHGFMLARVDAAHSPTNHDRFGFVSAAFAARKGRQKQEMKERQEGGGSSFGAGHKCPTEAGAARCPDVTRRPLSSRGL